MAIEGIYDTGTISVNAGATAVTGVGTAWATVGITPGDKFEAGGLIGIIESITDNTHLTLTRGWPGASNLSGAGYQIIEDSWLRSAISTTQRQIGRIVNILNGTGYIYPVAAGGTPDNSLGEDGQYAFDLTNLRLWQKSGGVWPASPTHIGRVRLTSNVTYFVRTDGSDSNTGLENTSGGAKASITAVYNYVRDYLDINGYTVTINVQPGTYGAQTISGRASGTVIIQLNSSSTILDANSSSQSINVNSGAIVNIYGGKIQNSGSGHGLYASDAGTYVYKDACEFGACGGSQMIAVIFGFLLYSGNVTLSGGATYNLQTYANGRIECYYGAITAIGSPAFVDFVNATWQSQIVFQKSSVSGTITGARWWVSQQSHVDTFGGGASYIPGDSAGTTDATTYGVYT